MWCINVIFGSLFCFVILPAHLLQHWLAVSKYSWFASSWPISNRHLNPGNIDMFIGLILRGQSQLKLWLGMFSQFLSPLEITQTLWNRIFLLTSYQIKLFQIQCWIMMMFWMFLVCEIADIPFAWMLHSITVYWKQRSFAASIILTIQLFHWNNRQRILLS